MVIMELMSVTERRISSPTSMCKQDSCMTSVSSGTLCTQYFQKGAALTSIWIIIERPTMPVSLANLIAAQARALSIAAGQGIAAHTQELITLTGTFMRQQQLCNYRQQSSV